MGIPMNSAIERLLSLRVSDVMSQDVVQVPDHYSMSEAAKLLREKQVTGAPVVDSLGKCVGMLSSTDFASRESEIEEDLTDEFSFGSRHVLAKDAECRPISIEGIDMDAVRQHMSAVVQSVRPDVTLLDAARTMCGEHLHRLVVLDETSRVTGVVSSLDVVASLIAAIEE